MAYYVWSRDRPIVLLDRFIKIKETSMKRGIYMIGIPLFLSSSRLPRTCILLLWNIFTSRYWLSRHVVDVGSLSLSLPNFLLLIVVPLYIFSETSVKHSFTLEFEICFPSLIYLLFSFVLFLGGRRRINKSQTTKGHKNTNHDPLYSFRLSLSLSPLKLSHVCNMKMYSIVVDREIKAPGRDGRLACLRG